MFYVSCWWENERLLWCTHWLVNLKVHRECHKSLWCPREGDFTSEAEINKIIKKERCLAWWLLVVYVSVFWLRAAPSFQSRHNSHSWNQLRSHCLSINICKTSQQRVKINHTTPGSKICSRLQRLWEFDIIIHDLFFFTKNKICLWPIQKRGGKDAELQVFISCYVWGQPGSCSSGTFSLTWKQVWLEGGCQGNGLWAQEALS